MQWHSLINLRQSDVNEISADIQVLPNSPWFCGHFPGKPILPGIAQLGMVFDAINQTYNQNLIISGFRRVRFKQIVRPNDLLRVIARPLKREAWSYSFRIMVEDELVCSGVMTVENRKNQKPPVSGINGAKTNLKIREKI